MGDEALRGARLETAHRFAEEVVNALDPEALAELVTPTYRLHETGGVIVEGRRGVAERIGALRRGFPDLRHYVLDRLVDRNRMVERWALEGVHRGPFLGLEPTGRRVRVEGVAVLRFEGARIAEAWQYWDRLALFEQLGVSAEAPRASGMAEGRSAPSRGEEHPGRSW